MIEAPSTLNKQEPVSKSQPKEKNVVSAPSKKRSTAKVTTKKPNGKKHPRPTFEVQPPGFATQKNCEACPDRVKYNVLNAVVPLAGVSQGKEDPDMAMRFLICPSCGHTESYCENLMQLRSSYR